MDMRAAQTPGEADSEPSGFQLAIRLREGDVGLFESLMRRYNQRLFRLARSMVTDDDEAEDILQASYIKAWLQKEHFGEPYYFAGWLSRIVTREALMRLRARRRLVLFTDTVEDMMVSRSPQGRQTVTPEQAQSNRQLCQLLEQAVDALPRTFRSVFMLRAVQQLSVNETALSLSLPEATVKTRYHRARNLLRKALMAEMERQGLQLYEFAGHRCDRIVAAVLGQLKEQGRRL
ncbi:RNA polymerase sigma-70 factor (ECF subfamily) [Oceanisphaera litoralis]|uniref:RNA polymerase sigma factor n=1 Tax=Oceanisphaera litoralis TaxID=225144 RepID=UPI001959D74A|nr:RNA polymerase sigma factor [Oceanisphaera litoralis]MBM7456232.1 RNA polymerase sigma-70 factor (ECF subfamily) [Oceanisphaera litoralis]